MCEVPTVTGDFSPVTVAPDFSSPFSPAPARQEIVQNKQKITELNNKISVDAKCAFKQCHEVLREPGKELLVFMLTDKDRKQHKNEPYSYPVAYALKGSSMTNKHLQYLVDCVRAKLIEKKIPVLSECYDGQWHKFITEDRSGNRLTRLYGHENWVKFSGYTREKCFEEIASISVVKKSTQQMIANTPIVREGNISHPEIWLKKGVADSLTVSTGKEVMRFVHSVHPASRPDLYDISEIRNENELDPNHVLFRDEKYKRDAFGRKIKRKRMYKCLSIFSGTCVTNPRKRKKIKLIGLENDEQNLLDVIKTNGLLQTPENDVDQIEPDQLVNGDIEQATTLDSFLRSERCSIVQNILNELINVNSAKWSSFTFDDIYPGLVTSAQSLMTKTTLKELNIICMELRCATGRQWNGNNSLKAEIVNVITKAFGGTDSVPVSRRKNKFVNPESLIHLCITFMRADTFPIQHLQIPIASMQQIRLRNEWLASASLPTQTYVPGKNGEGTTINFFSYPEYVSERRQIEFRTFDFTHILTNLRTQILTRGLDYCPKEHFHHLCEHRPGLLSYALVHEKTDQQNAFTAMRMFSYDVEVYMRENNFIQTANFIKLVRNWHEACNKRGIEADKRVSHLVDMHNFLTTGVNFDCVPFQFPGRYIKGLTWQTYEAILQMISTRIQLYSFANRGTYNSRAISTLANESFFADLVRYDKESHGYPKGTNVARVFGRVVLINHFKHKSDKNYCLAATVKSKYEVKLADINHDRYTAENEVTFDGMFRNHFFDYPDKHKSQRVRRDDISTGLQPLRNSGSVRRWFKIVEEDILSETRGGNKVKGFSIDKNVY